MAIDPSIALGFKTPDPVNPLDTINKALQLRAAQNQNALFQGQQAIGQNYQQATNPDGSIDTAKLAQLNAQNPAAAVALPAATTQAQALQTAQQGRSMAAQAHVNQTLVSMLSLPDDQQNAGTYKAGLDQLVQNRSISPADEQAALSDMPPAGAPATAYRQFGLRHAVQNLGGQQAMETVYGTNTATNTGGQTVLGVQPSAAMPGPLKPTTVLTNTPAPSIVPTGGGFVPQSGGVPIAPTIPATMSPGEATTPIRIPQPDGSDKWFLHGQLVPPPTSPLGTGRMPSTLLNRPVEPVAGQPASPAPQPAPPAMAAPTPAGGLPAPISTSQNTAQQAASSARGAASAGAFADIANQGVAAKSQNAVLGNMLGDAANFTTGPTSVNNFKATAQRYTPTLAAAFGISPTSIAAQESFDKLAAQIATSQGASSDARLAVTQQANPNSSLTPAGVDMIVRQLQGNGDYTQARANLAASYPSQDNRAGFESEVGSKLDPRAFQFQRMTLPQRQAYVKSLTPDDQKAVRASYNWANDKGLFGG